MRALGPRDVGAVGVLVGELRSLWIGAGLPSSRDVATRSGGVSHSTVSETISGKRIPTWPKYRLIVTALGGDEQRFAQLWADATSPARTETVVIPVDLPSTAIEDGTQWYTVTRTWYLRAHDWFQAAHGTKRNGQEDRLEVHPSGQHDPRPLPAGMHCQSCDGHACPDVG